MISSGGLAPTVFPHSADLCIQCLCAKSRVVKLTKNMSPSTNVEISLPYSQQPATGPYPEPLKFMKITVFWVATLKVSVARCQRFGGIWCLLDRASLRELKNKKPTRCHLFYLPAAGSPDTTLAEPHPNSNTKQSKNNTANVVVQQHSRKLLKMDILMPETCWVSKK